MLRKKFPNLTNIFSEASSHSAGRPYHASAGFTIIEVLIVLAIAGLILLIVFLAVPALQRSNRNHNRRNEISRLATSASNFSSNNVGVVPSSSADVTTIITDAGTLNQYTGLAAASPLGTAANGKMSLVSGVQGVISVSGVQLVTAAHCDITAGNIGKTLGGANRQMALQYALEDSSGNFTLSQCLNVS